MAVIGCSDDVLNDSLPYGGRLEGASFSWTRAEDMETRAQFMRNYGLGYSYDAVRGSYCEWSDIRCQMFDRRHVESLSEQVLHTTLAREATTQTKFEYSLLDYVATVSMETTKEVDLGLYNNEKRKRQNFIEDGVQETFYYTVNDKITLVHSFFDYASLLALYPKDNAILTQSFRDAIAHLKLTDESNIAAVDSFLNVYGTHVIVSASLGGTLKVDMMNYLWRYNDKARTEAWTTEEFLNVVSRKNENRTGSDEYQWLEHARLNISAAGGDQSTLTGLLGEYSADGTRTFSTDGISQWRTSLVYDAADPVNSNVELVDMQVIPIWQVADVVDHQQALRIKAAVLQDVALQQELLGDWNFFDAVFPIRHAQAACQYRQSTGTWATHSRTDSDDQPMVVNIVSGGRYVATVCHERLEGHNLWVCYPVYEGKVKLACGLGVADDGTLWKVRWICSLGDSSSGRLGKSQTAVLISLNDQTTTPHNDQTTHFYITAGTVGVTPMEGITYAESYVLPCIALSGGVQPDGSYQSTAYDVVKSGDAFGLYAPGGLRNIVGFSPTTTTTGDLTYYKRDDNYTYIYNKNELKYE